MAPYDQILFWTKLGAIGTTAAAVATFCAVLVALWQTKYQNRKKLKVSFFNGSSISSFGEIDNCLGLFISNRGNREIILSQWGFQFNTLFKKKSYMLVKSGAFTRNDLGVQLPYQLNLENQCTLAIGKNSFITAMEKEIKEKKINPNRKLKLFVLDAVGHYYYCKSDKALKSYLNNTK